MKYIIEQRLLVDGVLTFYEDGTIELIPYKIDDQTHEHYVDLFPNDN